MKGLPEVKVERLRAVAETALARRLDAERLRRLEPEAALAELQEAPGIGPFYATLILVRSTGTPTCVPSASRGCSRARRITTGSTDRPRRSASPS
jgi:3-methyladenine DNA glycosylase/8-oxoguanine DNA glycosylase